MNRKGKAALGVVGRPRKALGLVMGLMSFLLLTGAVLVPVASRDNPATDSACGVGIPSQLPLILQDSLQSNSTGDSSLSVPHPEGPVYENNYSDTWYLAPIIFVNSTGDFSGTVSFYTTSSSPAVHAFIGIPESVTISPGNGGFTFLNIDFSNLTPSGTYTVTLIGESGSLRHSVNIPVTVIAPLQYASFHMSIDPTKAILDAGSSTTFTLTVISLNGYSGSVSLAVGSIYDYLLKPYVSYCLNPTILTISPGKPATAKLEIKAEANSPIVVAGVVITAIGTGHTERVSVGVQVGPHFDMTADPSSFMIQAGSNTSTVLTLTSYTNFSFDASFWVEQWFPGSVCYLGGYVGAAYTPPPCPSLDVTLNTVTVPAHGTTAALVRISTTPSQTPGNYYVTINSEGCACTEFPSVTLNVTVTPQATL